MRQPSGAASVSLSVERPATLALLRGDAPALQSALDRAGVPVADRHLSMTLAADPAPSATSAAATSLAFAGGGSGAGGFGEGRAPPSRPDGPQGDVAQAGRCLRRPTRVRRLPRPRRHAHGHRHHRLTDRTEHEWINRPDLRATGANGTGSAGQSALASLTDNYQSFLQMLMTQLQNQDPTSPMDSSTFTTELVQFAGVEQQINTNSNLTSLIQLTQDNTVVQSSQLYGKQVQATSTQLSLQSSQAGIDFIAPSAEPVTVGISNATTGQVVFSGTLAAAAGANSWVWNGQTLSGSTAPDGVYNVAVSSAAADGTSNPLPFTIVGTVTGVQTTGGTVTLDLGSLPINMTAVTSVGN